MLEQLLNVLGKPFVLPAAFVLVGAWMINKLGALHDSRRRSRIEFLERWEAIDRMDDMRLEVTVRHLIGTYLPAEVIRTIDRTPFPTQTLFDLASIWSFVRFDPQTQQLVWKKLEYGETVARGWMQSLMMLGYFAFALVAVLSFYMAAGTDPSEPAAWISGLNTLMFLALAGSCLGGKGARDNSWSVKG